jgi:hypothetical protein
MQGVGDRVLFGVGCEHWQPSTASVGGRHGGLCRGSCGRCPRLGLLPVSVEAFLYPRYRGNT